MKGRVTDCPVLIKKRREALEKFLQENSFRNPEIVKVDVIRGTARIAFDVSLVPDQEKRG